MFKLSQLKELRVYRNKQILLDVVNNSKRLYYNLITSISNNRDEFINIILDNIFIKKYYSSYYTPKKIIFKTTTGKILKNIRQVRPIYRYIKEKIPFINYMYEKIEQYNGRNLYYDTSDYVELLNSLKNNTNTESTLLMDGWEIDSSDHNVEMEGMSNLILHKQYNYYINNILLENIPSIYSKKYLILRIDDNVKIKNKTNLIKQNITDIKTYFIYLLLYNRSLLSDKFKDIKLIFINETGLFFYMTLTDKFLKSEKIDPKIYNLLVRFLRMMTVYNENNVEEMREFDNDLNENNSTEIPLHNIVTNIIEKKFIGFKDDVFRNDKLADKISNTIEKIANNIIENNVSTDVTNSIKSELIDNINSSTNDKPIYLDKSVDLEDDYDDITNDNDDNDEKYKENFDDEELEKILEKDEPVQIIDKETLDKLNTKQLESKVKLLNNEKTVKELISEFKIKELDIPIIPVKTRSEETKKSTTINFDKYYHDSMLDPTIVSIFKSFSENKSIPLFIKSIKKDDTSTNMTKQYTYTVNWVEVNGKEHTIIIDIPKLVNGKYYYVNGSKKMLRKQRTPIPIIKPMPDEVNIVTNDNKAFITRFGKTLNPKTEIIKKFLFSKINNDFNKEGIFYELGDSKEINILYKTTIEYDDLSEKLYTLKIGDEKNNIVFHFNQKDILDLIEKNNLPTMSDKKYFPIAIKTVNNVKEVIYINNENSLLYKYNVSLLDFIIDNILNNSKIDNVDKIFKTISIPKNLMHSRILFINTRLPLIIFLSYLFGFKNVLRKANIKYELYDKKKTFEGIEGLNKAYIQFKDCYLYYDIYPIENSLLMNGVTYDLDTTQLNIEDMENQETYLALFESMFNTRHISKGYKNSVELMIDPITKTILEYMKLPTDYLELFIYANSLLNNNNYTPTNDMSTVRIRGAEIIPVLLYKTLSTAYKEYKQRTSLNNSLKINVDRNDIYRRLQDSTLFNEYDTLNPIRELETIAEMTEKGPGGINIDEAYTLKKRAYVKSMKGIIAISGPDGSSIGITKYLTYNARILNNFGFVKSGEDSTGLKGANMASISELTTPFAVDRDDPSRIGFITKESKHIVPVKHTDPLLICNGIEKTIPYLVSTDFVSVAKDDGTVLKVDLENNLAIVKYKSGTVEAIDLTNRPDKNGGGGFFILNEKIFLYKEGDKFKKNDILAKNPSYFGNRRDINQYQSGTLASVAVIMSHKTFEDSSFINERLASKLASNIVVRKQVVLGAKAKIEKIVNEGDYVYTGEPLITFRNEIDSDEINELLDDISSDVSIDEDEEDDVKSLIIHTPKAKHSGIIHSIKIYYTVPLEEMSESVKNVVKRYINKIKNRENLMKSYNAQLNTDISDDYIGITNPGSGDRINGAICPKGNILIEFYQMYEDVPAAGDKIIFYASMKTIIQKRMSMDECPRILGSGEHIDAVLNPISINARMVTSILYALYSNKILINLKRKCKDIHDTFKKSRLVKKEASSLIDVILEELKDSSYNISMENNEYYKNIYIILYNDNNIDKYGLSTDDKNMLTYDNHQNIFNYDTIYSFDNVHKYHISIKQNEFEKLNSLINNIIDNKDVYRLSNNSDKIDTSYVFINYILYNISDTYKDFICVHNIDIFEDTGMFKNLILLNSK